MADAQVSLLGVTCLVSSDIFHQGPTLAFLLILKVIHRLPVQGVFVIQGIGSNQARCHQAKSSTTILAPVCRTAVDPPERGFKGGLDKTIQVDVVLVYPGNIHLGATGLKF